MAQSGSIQNQATAGDANDAVTAILPRDVLVSVLLRLRATDLRRFRHVCKEWRAIISDPAFIDAHTVHGPRALTHTVVFVRGRTAAGRAYGYEPHGSDGFLFDENWRLTARFAAGESEDMVGTCNGLLCFLDTRQGAITVVDPFTGESLALPLPPPPETERLHERAAYCFGFARSSRRYKIFHQGRGQHRDATAEQDLYVYTMGRGESWRRAHAGAAGPGVFYSDPEFVDVDGSVYWHIDTTDPDQPLKLERFDLATEESTSESIDFLRVGNREVFAVTNSDARVCLMTVGFEGQCEWDAFSRGEDGRWVQDSCSGGVMLPDQLRLACPHAFQRGHLLLEDHRDRGLYVHPLVPASNDLGRGRLLLKKGKEQSPGSGNTPGLFVPVPAQLNQDQEQPAVATRAPYDVAKSFCYAPPLSTAPLAHYFAQP